MSKIYMHNRTANFFLGKFLQRILYLLVFHNLYHPNQSCRYRLTTYLSVTLMILQIITFKFVIKY